MVQLGRTPWKAIGLEGLILVEDLQRRLATVTRGGRGFKSRHPGQNFSGRFFSSLFLSVSIRKKSALGWLANKGEWWMPRLEKAMKDAA